VAAFHLRNEDLAQPGALREGHLRQSPAASPCADLHANLLDPDHIRIVYPSGETGHQRSDTDGELQVLQHVCDELIDVSAADLAVGCHPRVKLGAAHQDLAPDAIAGEWVVEIFEMGPQSARPQT